MEGYEFAAELPKRQKNANELMNDELESDYQAYFSAEECELYERPRADIYGSAERKLQQAINRWWFEKYGFPFAESKSRNELLIRKYEQTEVVNTASQLQKELFQALKDDNNEEYKRIYEKYILEFPDQLEGVTALLEFSPHLDRHNYLNEHSFQDPEFREQMLCVVEESTQYSFLLSHFLANNSSDKEFLGIFWDVLEKVAAQKGMTKVAHQLRRGILSQVAVYHVFDRLGMNPKLSHPQEDAFKSVDLWVEGEGAVQIKGSDKRKDEMFIETDEVDFPGVQTDGVDGRLHVNSHLFKEFNRFRAKLSRYQEELQIPLKGYFAVVPYHEFDHITGIPSEEIVKRSAVSLGVKYEPELTSATSEGL